MDAVRHESLIDPTSFGIIASYLRSRRSPIEYILHVKDRAILAPLAEKLDELLMKGPGTPGDILRVMELLPEGSLLVSSRRPLALEPQLLVDVSSIPVDAPCSVLYLAPFYLAHTPGLFDETLQCRARTPTPRRLTFRATHG